MSHIEEGKTNLVFKNLAILLQEGKLEELQAHPCMKLLHQAVLLVAKQYGGEIRSYYYTYAGNVRPANTALALHIPPHPDKPEGEALPRGIGLVIDLYTGALTFRGDPWDVDPPFYQQVQQAIVQRYIALAHMAVLQQMQYQVRAEQREDQIVIMGGSYGA